LGRISFNNLGLEKAHFVGFIFSLTTICKKWLQSV